MEKGQFVQGKSVWKGLKICTSMFLGIPITMHYVRTLCDKYFLSYDGFLELPLTKNEKKTHQFVQGKSVLKGLNICTCRFLGMLITTNYVRTLYGKYFLSYDGIFLDF